MSGGFLLLGGLSGGDLTGGQLRVNLGGVFLVADHRMVISQPAEVDAVQRERHRNAVLLLDLTVPHIAGEGHAHQGGIGNTAVADDGLDGRTLLVRQQVLARRVRVIGKPVSVGGAETADQLTVLNGKVVDLTVGVAQLETV